MKKIFINGLMFAVCVLMVGCASKAYLPTHPDSPDYATMTLFRVNAEPTAPRLNIYAEDRKVAALKNHDLVTFSLPIGTHRLSIDWPNTDSYFENVISVDVKGREHYYIAIIHGYAISNFKRSARREVWLQGEMAHAIQLDEEDAKANIAENIL